MTTFKPGWYAVSNADAQGNTPCKYFAERNLVTCECYVAKDGRQVYRWGAKEKPAGQKDQWLDSYRFLDTESGGKWDNEKTKTEVSSGGSGDPKQPPRPAASPCEDLSQRCPACDRNGLMILPLRYAVANADVSASEKVPALGAPFGATTDAIKLPANLSQYTLRLLREGYLYVFNEKLGAAGWKGYTSDEHGYLAEFDLNDKNPPPAKDGSNAPCGRRAGSEMARCIAIPDAHLPEKLGNVWMAFTDTPWTPDVLKRHRDSAEMRKRNMRCIDAKAWAGSGTDQPHVADLAKSIMKIAEFKIGTHILDRLMQPLNFFWPLGMEGAVVTNHPAFNGSSAPFHSAQGDMQKMLDGARVASKGVPVAMMALEDPVGIATDLNAQIIRRVRNWHDEPLRKWKRESAHTISALRQAVQHGAVQRTSQNRATTVGLFATWFPATSSGVTRGRNVGEKMENAGYIKEEEAERIGIKEWNDDHVELFDQKKQKAYLEKEFPAELKAFEASTVDPLDEAYIAWMDSTPYRDHFICNFDPKNMDSGLAYVQKVFLVLADAIGRQKVAKFLLNKLEADPAHPGEVELRALMLNQDKLIDGWVKSAKSEAWKGEALPWDALGGHFYGMFKDTVTGDGYLHYLGVPGKDKASGLLGVVAKYSYMLSGPMVKMLGRMMNGATTWAVASLPQKRVMALLGAVAKAENPNFRLIDLRSTATRKQASRMVAGILANMSGGQGHQYRSAVRESLDRIADAEGRRYPYNAILLVDEDAARRIGQLSGAARDAHIRANVLSHQDFESMLSRSVRQVSNLEAKASFVGTVIVGLTLSSAWKEMQKADAEEKDGKIWNFAGGVGSLVGGMVETAGLALAKTAWGNSRHAVMLLSSTQQYSTRAGLLIGGGKLLGAIGGFIGGALAIDEGFDDFAISPWYGASMITLGLATIVAACLALAFALPVLGLVIGLLVAILMLVVSLFKPTKIQKWLDASYYGLHKRKQFESHAVELDALKALSEED